MVSFGAILGTTLSPIPGIPDAALQGSCQTTRIGIAPIADLLAVTEASLNVALFIPLGICLGLMDRSRRAGFAVFGAFLLPFAIEVTQLLVPALNRYCDTADIADNLTGLIVGLIVGAVTAGASRHHMRRRRSI